MGDPPHPFGLATSPSSSPSETQITDVIARDASSVRITFDNPVSTDGGTYGLLVDFGSGDESPDYSLDAPGVPTAVDFYFTSLVSPGLPFSLSGSPASVSATYPPITGPPLAGTLSA